MEQSQLQYFLELTIKGMDGLFERLDSIDAKLEKLAKPREIKIKSDDLVLAKARLETLAKESAELAKKTDGIFKAEERHAAKNYHKQRRDDIKFEKDAAKDAARYHADRAKEVASSPAGKLASSRQNYMDYAMSHGADEAKAAAYTELKLADNTKKFNEELKRMQEPMTYLQEGMRTIGQGGFRRGVSQIVTGALGGGSGAELIGGFSGAIASSLALPIAWAIGNAIMNTPQTIKDTAADLRTGREIGSRAFNPENKEAWNLMVGRTRDAWGHTTGRDGGGAGGEVWYSTLVRDAAASAQKAMPFLEDGDTEQAMIQRTERYLNQGALLQLGGRIKNAGDFVATMTQLDTRSGVDAARSKILQDPFFRAQWIQDRQKQEGWSVKYAEMKLEDNLKIPQETLNRRKAMGQGMSSTDAEAIKNLVQRYAANDAESQGMYKQKQEEWYPIYGQRRGSLFIRDEAELPQAHRQYLQAARDAYEKHKTAQNSSDIFDEMADRNAQSWLKVARSRGPSYGLSQQQMDEYDKRSRGYYDPSGLPGLQNVDPLKNLQTAAPQQYSFSSFGGLAEQMQQMLSGTVDMQTRTAEAVVSIDKKTPDLNQKHPAQVEAMVR